MARRDNSALLILTVLLFSCGKEDGGSSLNQGDAGTAIVSRPGRPSSVAVTDASPSNQGPSVAATASLMNNPTPAVSVPPGAELACSDAEGVPVCCNEEGACWGHDAPDDTDAPPDGSTWKLMPGSTSPPARHSHALAYDANRERLVLFGGRTNPEAYFGDTWEYDGESWAEVSTSSAPLGRRNHSLVYDESRGRVVLFGGWNGEVLGDTWEYDGEDWIEVETAEAPSARDGYGLAYDRARDRVVLFGGYEARNMKADTWEYDGTDWTKVPTDHAPEARHTQKMVYDASLGRVVLFGGRGGERTSATSATPAPPDECRAKAGNEALGDTWEYDGVDWLQMSPPLSPVARLYHAMTYDSVRERVILFGGYDAVCEGVFLGDTWEYSAGTWVPTGPSMKPPRRLSHALEYDVARERVILFGGSAADLLDDTWEYAGP